MKIFTKVGDYDQKIEIKKEGISITCDCMHGSLHPGAYEKGEGVCKHIKAVMKILEK